MMTKYVVTVYTTTEEFKATKGTFEEVVLFMSKYEWVRVSIAKRRDI